MLQVSELMSGAMEAVAALALPQDKLLCIMEAAQVIPHQAHHPLSLHNTLLTRIARKLEAGETQNVTFIK